MSREPDEALEVLRGIWTAQAQTAADVDAHSGHGRACQRMADVGFDGEDEDLRAAWRGKLAREGKLSDSGGSVHDLVFGPAESA